MSSNRQRQSDFWETIHFYKSNSSKKLRAASYHYILSPSNAVFYITKNLIYFLFWKKKLIIKKEKVKNKIWLLCSSLNNYNSLKFLSEKFEDTIFVTTNTSSKNSDLKDFNRLSFHYNLKYCYQFPRNFLLVYRKYGIFSFKIIDVILEGSGMINTCIKILQQDKPKVIVFANDHTLKNRSLLLAAKKIGIPTIYIQHASVTKDFPSLKFDLSLLEGQDSLDKYKEAGEIEGLVKLVGMPKFDEYSQFRNKGDGIKSIGICTNKLDNKKDILKLINFLKKYFPQLQITYRPHPNDTRQINLPKDINLSISKVEMIFDFLLKQDLIIAGNSSLHLEAILLNVLSIYYPLTPSTNFDDHYGYVKNKLIKKIASQENLKAYIQAHQNKKIDVWKKAMPYNATINTKFEGQSQELAVVEISNFLKKRNIELSTVSSLT